MEYIYLLFLLLLSNYNFGEDITLVRSAGASFPQQVYKAWASSYIAERPDINVEYNSTGSGRGKELIVEGKEIVFAGSDSVLTDEDYQQVPDLRMLPYLSGGIVPFAKSFETIILSRELLGEVFLGNIEFWDDPQIIELNPNQSFPHAKIIVIYRSDKSGTTEVFTTALSKFSAEWNDRFGASSTWPDELIAQSDKYLPAAQNEGVFTLSTLTPFSITYVSYTFIENSLSEEFYIRLINKAGAKVSCTPSSVSAATKDAVFSDRFTADITDSNQEEAWPISAFTYIIIRQSSTDITLCDEFWEGIQFLYFANIYYIPQLLIDLNGFAPINIDIINDIISIFNSVTCDNNSLFSSNNPLILAPERSSYFYYSFSEYTTISSASYSTFFNSLGSSIPSSEADTYDPTTIDSLYSSNIVYERYYEDNFDESTSNTLQPNILCILSLLFCFSYFIHSSKYIRLLFIIYIIMIISCYAQEKNVLKIAGFYPFTGYLASEGSSCEAATRVAVSDLNEGYLFNTSTSIEFQSFDTSSDPGQGLQALNSARNSFNMFGILGCHDDLTSSTVALSSTLFLFPQISYGSRSNFLSNNDFPFFTRIIPAFYSEGSALASIISIYGWENIGVIFSADDYGVQTSETFISSLPNNVETTSVQYTPGATVLDPQMQILRNSLVRIIVMFPSSFDDSRTILKEAYRYHLIEDNFIWFGGSFTAESKLFYNETNEETNQLIKSLAQGMISIKLKGGYGDKYNEFLDIWENLDPSQYSGSGKRSLSSIAPFAYDSLELFIRSFNEGVFVTLDEFISVIKNTQFDGLTGPISLNDSGDRLGIYDIVNLRDTNEGDRGWVTIGSWFEELINSTTKGTFFDYKVQFHSGSTEIPDVEVRPSVEYWNCDDKEMQINEDGKIQLDHPGPDAERIADFYHCDTFIDCYNFSDESYDCNETNYLVLFIIIGILTGLLILITCCLIPFTILFGYLIPRVRIRSASPPFLLLIAINIITGYSSVYAWFGQPSAVACGFQPWLLGLSIISLISVLVAKNLRIWKIFRSPLKRQKITNVQVFIFYLILIIPGIFILFLWTLISTPTALLKELDGRQHYVCDTGGFTGPPGGYVFFGVFVGYSGLILLLGAITSILTRKVPSLFNESRLIAISIYNILILSVIIIPIYFVLQQFNPFVGWIIRSLAILYAFTATSCLMFLPKVIGLISDGFKDPKNIKTSSSSLSKTTDLSLNSTDSRPL